MEDEIDIRPYFELLIKRWYWIVGAAILAGLIAFGVTSLQDPVYEATALVAVTQERLIARFDPRLDTTEERQPVDALPELATSDGFLRVLLEEINPPVDGIESVGALRKLLSAEPGDDPSLIRLIVQYEKPETAARIANLWGQQFVLLSNDIYGDGGQEQVDFFEEQSAQAGNDLAATEEALVSFQSVNRKSVISNTLSSLQQQQRFFLDRKQKISALLADVQDLHTQFSDGQGSTDITFADQLTALALQLRAYNATSQLPIQFQLDNTSSLSEITRSEQTAYLEDLLATLDSRSEKIEQDISELEPAILQLQGELQEAQAEFRRLTLNRNIAQETYQSLARKVDEERITAEDMTRGIRLASEAAVPEKTIGSRTMTNAIVAMFLGIIFSISVVLAISWWRKDSEQIDAT